MNEKMVYPFGFIDVPAWSGEGLPPVGTVCEFYADEDDWRRCEIVAHRNEMAIVWVSTNHIFASQGGILRPIRTPEQIAVEERDKAAELMKADMDGWKDGHLADYLCGLGYRKQEAP